MTTLLEFLEEELVSRSWRPADLARAAGVPQATISHILNGSRRAGPEVCNALARALGERPERIFRLAGLLPSLPPAVEEEREAVAILRDLPPELRTAAMRMLRSLKPGAAADSTQAAATSRARPPIEDRPPAANRPPIEDRDPYLEVLEQLWDKAPDWKKKDIAAQIRIAVEEYQREQERVASQQVDGGRGTSQRGDGDL